MSIHARRCSHAMEKRPLKGRSWNESCGPLGSVISSAAFQQHSKFAAVLFPVICLWTCTHYLTLTPLSPQIERKLSSSSSICLTVGYHLAASSLQVHFLSCLRNSLFGAGMPSCFPFRCVCQGSIARLHFLY